MVKVVPYLAIPNAKAKAALEEYKQVFDIEVKMHSPFEKESGVQMGLPENYDWENSTMHSEFTIDGQVIYMSDHTGSGDAGLQQISVLLEIEDKEKIEKYCANADSQGWTALSKLEKTFWGAWFARYNDPYGISWQFNFQEESYNP